MIRNKTTHAYLLIFLAGTLLVVMRLAMHQHQYKSAWKFVTQAPVTGGAAHSIPKRIPYAIDARLLFTNDYHGHVYAIDKLSGKQSWSTTAYDYSPYPPTIGKSALYISGFDARIRALHLHTGKELWQFTIPKLIQPDTPAYETTAQVVFGGRDGTLYGVNKNTGLLEWQFQATPQKLTPHRFGQPIIHFGMIATKGNRILVNSPTPALHLIDSARGIPVRTIPLASYTQESPIIVGDVGLVKNGKASLMTIDINTGSTIWHVKTPPMSDVPLVLSNSAIYAVDTSGVIHIFSLKTGSEIAQNTSSCIAFGTDPKFFVSEPHTFVATAQNTLCAARSKDMSAIRTITVPGVIHDIFALPGEHTAILYRDNKRHHTIRVIQSKNGKTLYEATNIDILPTTIHVQDSILYFVGRNQRVVHAIDTVRLTKPEGKALLQSCCATDSIDDPPNLVKWHQEPQTVYGSLSQRLRRVMVMLTADISHIQSEQEDGYIELTITHDDAGYANPWVDAKVQATFSDNAGSSVTVKGFFYEKNTWKVRFATSSPGQWLWRVQIKNMLRTTSKRGAFDVKRVDPKGHLTIRQLPTPHLAYTNGLPFFGVGLQDSVRDFNFDGNPLNQWGDIDTPPLEGKFVPTVDMERYFKQYTNTDSGFNLFRFSVDNSSFRLWQTLTSSGNRYGVNQGVFGDDLVKAARRNSMSIWMTVFGFEPPFPQDIKNSKNRRAVEAYLDYVVARYGALVDIWELMNEAAVSDDWIQFAAGYLKKIDPYHHPITTNWERPNLPEIELNSIHWYDNEAAHAIDAATNKVVQRAQFWKKLVVISEQGNKNNSWSADSALRFRVKLWISFLRNTPIIFWNQTRGYYQNANNANIYLGKTERAYVAAFRILTNQIHEALSPRVAVDANNNVRIYAAGNSSQIIGYMYHFLEQNSHISGMWRIAIPKDATVTWIDPKTGSVIHRETVAKGVQVISSPMFNEDMLVHIEFLKN